MYKVEIEQISKKIIKLQKRLNHLKELNKPKGLKIYVYEKEKEKRTLENLGSKQKEFYYLLKS